MQARTQNAMEKKNKSEHSFQSESKLRYTVICISLSSKSFFARASNGFARTSKMQPAKPTALQLIYRIQNIYMLVNMVDMPII